MKKILSLLALVMLSCMGAWANPVYPETGKYYKMHCLATGGHPSARYINISNGTISPNSATGTYFEFERAENDGQWYIKDVESGKYLDVESVAAGQSIILSEAPGIYWTTSGPYHTDGIRLHPNGDETKWLNNVNNVLSLKDGGATGECSSWVLEERVLPIVKGEAITSQSQLSNGDKVILNVKAKNTEYYVYYTAEDNNVTAKNNYRAHAYTGVTFPQNHIWEVVDVTDGNPATFKLKNCADNNAYLPNGVRHNNGDASANLYMRETTGYTGEKRFAFSFTNFPSAGGTSYDTYHFDTNANTNETGIGVCFWGYNQTTTDTQGAFAIYRAEEAEVVNVTYNITVTDDNDENSVTFSHEEEEIAGTMPTLDLAYVKDVNISNAANVSSTNNVFTATAKYDYPMMPGKLYQIKFGSTYVQYVDDNNVSIKMTSDVNNDKNLWYIIPTTGTFNKFKLCNAYKGQAVGSTTHGASACNFKSVTEQGDEFTFIKRGDNFQINWYGSTQNLGSHGTVSNVANAGLGKWDNGDTQFAAIEVEAAELKLTNPNPEGTSGLDGKYVGTFSAPYNVALPAGVKAYTAAIDGTTVNFTELGDVVPANTGVLLYAVDATAPINEKAAVATDKTIPNVSGNFFVVVINGTIAAGKYVLGNGSNGVGFYARATESAVVKNKAYLEVPAGSNLNAFRFDFEDTLTSIKAIEGNTNVTIFDLQGRRVQNAKDGFYIINGKKVIR